METASNHIVHLSDDFIQIVLKTYGNNFEMIRLCKDHHVPILLNDNRAVLEITQDEFVGIFDLNSNHYFLTPEQLIRFGQYCKLPLANITALMLKAEWESFLAEMTGYSNETGIKLKSLLEDKNLIERYVRDFSPDKAGFYNLLKDSNYNINGDKNIDHIEFIIDDLLKENNFLNDNDYIYQLYAENNITEKILLKKIPESERNTYFHLKIFD